MLFLCSILPVIGVPVKSSNSIDDGSGFVYSTNARWSSCRATVALDKNAGILAAQIIGSHDNKGLWIK
jgi:phosphoribosylcarboxyaminoimidazole (NCAIR) mutase